MCTDCRSLGSPVSTTWPKNSSLIKLWFQIWENKTDMKAANGGCSQPSCTREEKGFLGTCSEMEQEVVKVCVGSLCERGKEYAFTRCHRSATAVRG